MRGRLGVGLYSRCTLVQSCTKRILLRVSHWPVVDSYNVLTKEYPSYERMSEELLIVSNIAHRQKLELTIASTTRAIDGKQDGPDNATSCDANSPKYLEIP